MTHRHRLLLLATTALMPLSVGMAYANPLGGQVVGGSATIAGQGTSTVTVKQTSQNTAINWNSFNIGAGQTTQFVQPNASSVILDRVTGGAGPSQIFGNLIANGIVFLVNPNGILFGRGSQVNVGGLLATTHDISTGDVMAGRYNFNISGNPAASVINQGNITAASGGFAGLVAPGVRNAGVITATLGTVGIAAGNSFTLDLYGDSLIKLAPGDAVARQVVDVATGKPLTSLISNSGKLSANGGRVQITAAAAKALVNSVINNKGVIEADSVGQRNGMIVLGAATGSSKPAGVPVQTVKVGGTISVAGTQSGTTGGTILVTGGNIALTGAKIDASGKAGGGTVLIGGDTGGGAGNSAVAGIPQAALQPYAVPTAATVSIDAASTITGSATAAGNGGKVVVWSDQSTTVAGLIRATGGVLGGNGGFVETSSHGVLNYTGTIDVSAAAGTFGTLLLDPYNVTISNGTDASGSLSSGTFTPTANDSVLNAATLTTALATANVVVTTGTGGTQAGNITVAAPVAWSSRGSLTLSAYYNVVVNAGIMNAGIPNSGAANSGGANVILRADNTGTGNGTVTFGPGGNLSTAGHVSIFYNPSVNPAGSVVNTTSYVNPVENYSGNVSGGGALTAYMLVNSVYDLQNMQNNLRGTYALGRNIDASATAGWNNGAGFVPIGSGGAGFTGTLDGRGLPVDRLAIASNAPSLGLFGTIGGGGAVANLGLTNVNISGISGNAQQIGGIAGGNAGTIRNVAVSGTISAQSDSSFAGGVAGANAGAIAASHANVTVSANGNEPSSVGGLVGYNTGTIYSSQASGAVSNGAAGFAGGLAGYNSGVISNSRSTASVGASPPDNVNDNLGPASFGGLVGKNDSGGRIVTSYASGNVEGGTFPNDVGGLVGWNGGTVSQAYATGMVSGVSNVGGLAGWNGGTVTQAYATGTVSGVSNVGGLVGWNGGTVSQAYAMGTVSGASNIGGLIGYNNGNVTQTYATGTVTGNSDANVGGVVGWNDVGGNIASSYWDMTATGMLHGAGINYGGFSATGLNTAHMQDLLSFQMTYVGWDFQNVWAPPNQAGQGGQTAAFYPQLYALSPVVWNAANNAASTYGGPIPTLTVTQFGGASRYVFGPSGDTLNITPSLSSTATPASNTGFYAVANQTPGLAISARGVDYRVVNTDSILTIDPATLTYVANPTTRTYGAVNPSLSGTVTGFVNGDNVMTATTGSLAFSTEAAPGSNVGTFAIVGSGLIANNGNYIFTQANANAAAFTITPATLTYVANATTRTYGAANPTLSGTVTGFVNGDTAANATTGSLAFSTAATPAFNVGSYAILGSGLAANNGNYVFTQANANAAAFTITPATLTYVANAVAIPSGAAIPNLGGNVTGFVNGDTLFTATTGTPSFATTTTPGANPGSYPIIGSGLAANDGNYTFVQAPGNPVALTITPPPLTARNYGIQQISNLVQPALFGGEANSAPVVTPIDLGPASGAVGSSGISGNRGAGRGPGSPDRFGGNGAPPVTRLIDMAVIPLPSGSGMPPPGETRFVADEVVFQIGNQVSPQQVGDIAARFGLTVIAAQPIDMLRRTIYTFRIPDGRSVRDIIRLIEASRVGGAVQPNYVFDLAQAPAALPDSAAALGDSVQYVVGKLQLTQTHRLSRGDNVIVAVIDSAIDANHPDIAGTVTRQIDAGCGNAAPDLHGTGMTGAIAAHRALVGIAPDVKVIAICAFGGAGATSQSNSIKIMKALDTAIAQGARVINMSFAGPRDPAIAQAIQIAFEKGIVLVGAAGNAGPRSPPLYPGADPHVIAVTATDQNDRLFSGANQGKYIAVAAPGVDILVPAPEGRAQLTTGTSVAAAEVSGVAALLIAQNPRRTPTEIRAILMATAKDLGPKGFDPQFGAGLVDPLRALQYMPRVSARAEPPHVLAQIR